MAEEEDDDFDDQRAEKRGKNRKMGGEQKIKGKDVSGKSDNFFHTSSSKSS